MSNAETATAVPYYCAPAPEVLIVGITRYRDGSPGTFMARVWVQDGTQDDAAAVWPKGCKMRSNTMRGYHEDGRPGRCDFTRPYRAGFVWGDAKLKADGVNGGENETGKRRARAILKAARKAGMTIHVTPAPGSLYDVRTGEVLHREDAEALAELEAVIAD